MPRSCAVVRGGSRTAATSKMELFVIIANGFQPLTIITKCSILDVAAVLDPSLVVITTALRRHIISSVKNFVTGKIIRHYLPTIFFAWLSENIN